VVADILANDLYRKLIYSGLVLIIQGIIRFAVDRYIINKREEFSTSVYTLRKVIRYTLTAVSLIIIYGIWVDQLGDFSVALGILAAGLAFALQEIIGSFAGWITIITGNPFNIGDRIETGGIKGDVVDIGILRTTVMEIGNWLDGDHNTGRLVTLSNAFIFKEPLFSYSVHLHYIWDEIRIPIPYGSDWQKAMAIMSNAVTQHSAYQALLPKAEAQRLELRKKIAVKITPLDPRIFVNLTDNWIQLGLVYPVDTDLRRVFRSEVSQTLLAEFKAAGIEIASETLSIVDFPGK
jgi:small-conductance mechanosensitive channel